MAEISVIVPVYKVESYLDRCVESVLSQSFSDFELILVDDGSPDNCPAMCDQWAEKDRRIHVIHQKNGGLSAARNAGLDWVMANSDSSWVMFLDSDDWIHRECLHRLRQAAAQGKAGIAACGFERVSEFRQDPVLKEPEFRIYTPEEAYVNSYGLCMTACCKIIDKSLLKTARFPLGKLHEDAFTTHKWIFEAEKIAVLPENMYFYYCNPQSITRKTWSPKRLDELEGHRVRLQYLREKGLPQAEAEEQRVLTVTIYEQLEILLKLKEPEYLNIREDLRRQLRQELKLAESQLPIDMENIWMYLAAWNWGPVWQLGKKAQNYWHARNRKHEGPAL